MHDRGVHGRQGHRAGCDRSLRERRLRRSGGLSWRVLVAVLLCAVLLWAVGCSTTDSGVTVPQRREKFIRTQAGDQVTLQWEGKPGQAYAVLYTTDRNRPDTWKPVPGYSSVVGRGGTTRLSFTSPVPGTRVYYRLEDRKPGP